MTVRQIEIDAAEGFVPRRAFILALKFTTGVTESLFFNLPLLISKHFEFEGFS
jgi:hypothetical protein